MMTVPRTIATLGLVLVAGCNAPLDRPEPAIDRQQGSRAAKQSAAGHMATLAGTSGTITTLGRYDDGTPHPGVNAIDIGAAGGSEIWHQIDYLADGFKGGFLYVWQAHEAGRCSQWEPGSPYYNGGKLYVQTYFLLDGAWQAHTAAYQHVEPEVPLDTWIRWNNANVDDPMWPAEVEHIDLGDQQAGGLRLGTVYPVARPIRNGPGGGVCTTGSHLHQEGEGLRAPRRFVGEGITGRYNDMQMFQIP